MRARAGGASLDEHELEQASHQAAIRAKRFDALQRILGTVEDRVRRPVAAAYRGAYTFAQITGGEPGGVAGDKGIAYSHHVYMRFNRGAVQYE